MSEGSDDTVKVLKDIRRWIKLIGLEEIREGVQEAVSDDDDKKEGENKIMFHLSDGSKSTKDIEEYVSVSYKTVSERQQKWARMGLMEKPAENQPYRKLVTLEEAGIEVPDYERNTGDD